MKVKVKLKVNLNVSANAGANVNTLRVCVKAYSIEKTILHDTPTLPPSVLLRLCRFDSSPARLPARSPAAACCSVAWPDLVDALPDPSPGRRVDELPSGAVRQASTPVTLHVQGVRVGSAAHRTDVPQVPQESDTFRQSDVLVEARERAAVTF